MIDNIASGKVLDVPNHSVDNGIRIDQWSDNGGGNQQWELVDAGNGLVKIVNVESKKTLQVRNSQVANGAAVEQWDDQGGPNQFWKVVDGGRGLVKFYSALGGNKVLDIPGGNPTNGVGLQIWDDVDAPSEHWALVMTNVKIVNVGSGKVMDLPGFNTADGTVIGQWDDNGGVNQRWRCYPIDSGLYSIGNMASAKFLDIGPMSPDSDGPQMVQMPMRPAAMSQRFALKDRGDGTVVIVNAAAAQPIHSSRGSTADGSAICLAGGGGDPTIGWRLV